MVVFQSLHCSIPFLASFPCRLFAPEARSGPSGQAQHLAGGCYSFSMSFLVDSPTVTVSTTCMGPGPCPLLSFVVLSLRVPSLHLWSQCCLLGEHHLHSRAAMLCGVSVFLALRAPPPHSSLPIMGTVFAEKPFHTTTPPRLGHETPLCPQPGTSLPNTHATVSASLVVPLLP